MEEVVMMCLGLGESLVVVLEVVMEEVVMVCLGFGLSLVVVLDNVSRYCVNDGLGAEKELYRRDFLHLMGPVGVECCLAAGC